MVAVRLPPRPRPGAMARVVRAPLLGPLQRAAGVLSGPPMRRRRRVWSNGKRAHVEVVGVDRVGAEALSRAVEAGLEARPEVEWARVNGPLGRVVVAFDTARGSARALVGVVEAIEAEHGVGGDGFRLDLPDHPGDRAAVARQVVAIGADVVGLGLSAFGRLLPIPPLPPELAGLASVVENQPRLRGGLERAVGRAVAGTSLVLANAISQGLGRGPASLVLDAVHRVRAVSEAVARQRCWEAREPELAGSPDRAGAPAVVVERPCPLPRGPIEVHADRAAVGAAAGFGLSLLSTRSARRASSVALAAVPKAAGLGREAFAAGLGRALAERGVVVADPGALRRLDRVDTVVVDADALLTSRLDVREMAPLAGGLDAGEVTAGFYGLFDPAHPCRIHQGDGWWLGPADDLPGAPARVRRAARDPAQPGHVVLALARDGRAVALAVLAPQPHPGMDALIAGIRRSGASLVTTGQAEGRLLSAADRVMGGAKLAGVVRALQAEGRVVAVVSADPAALAGADVGIGLCRDEACPPWGAHLLVHDDLAATCLLADAVGVARSVSRRSVNFALAGSSIGAAMALIGPARRSSNRAVLAVNLAGGVSLGWGAWSARELVRRPQSPPVDRTPWHAMPAAVVLDRLHTSPGGLGEAEAARRARARRGPAPAPVTLAQAFFEELANPLTPVLAVGASLSAAVGSVADAAIVSSVGVISALTGGIQRLATDRAMASLFDQAATPARVLRDGQERAASADQLVVGDVVRLAAGDGVPADCRLLEAEGVEADESALTGESLPVAKGLAPVVAEDLAERTSMLYEGTVMAAGSARAVVVATGVSTEAGRGVATSRTATAPVGVESRLGDLTRVTVPVALGAGAGVVLAGMARGRSLAQTLGAGVALTVAAVPEGLPFLVTAAQLAAARRLSARQALIKNPRTIEALGRADVLCFDKTGTLTEGRIVLREVSDGAASRSVGELDEGDAAIVAAGLRATPAPVDGRRLPHPTDQGVVDGAVEVGVERSRGWAGWRVMGELPFEPARGYHATLGRARRGAVLSVKGAPEVVLPRCTSWRSPSGEVAFDEPARAGVEAELDGMARRGLRVLAVAERSGVAGPAGAPALETAGAPGLGEAPGGPGLGETPGPALDDEDVRQLCFVGFLALADRARPTAAEAVRRLRAAGVQLVMITGDHPSTAEAVAAGLGLLDGGRVLTGADLERLSEQELDEVLPEVSVFARVSPTHKVGIVAAFQRTGRAVAMTGDGANDAPAIRLADVGIALGRRGTSAARDAADVVVADDRLETIVEALAEGRSMWGSVRDALGILLGGNLGEIGFTLVAAALSGRSPLNARQLLLVNLLTDLAPAMVLAVRAPDPSATDALLAEGPERSLGAALTRDIAVRAGATAFGASAGWGAARLSGRRARADTVGLVALVGAQLGQTLVLGRRDRAVVLTALGSTAVLAGVVQTPGVSQFFGCTPLGPVAWSTAVAAAAAATAGSVAVPALVERLGRRVPVRADRRVTCAAEGRIDPGDKGER